MLFYEFSIEDHVPQDQMLRVMDRFVDLIYRNADHAMFSRNRHGRFRDSALLRPLFEATGARYSAEGLVSGQCMAIHASLAYLIKSRRNGTAGGLHDGFQTKDLYPDAVGDAWRDWRHGNTVKRTPLDWFCVL